MGNAFRNASRHRVPLRAFARAKTQKAESIPPASHEPRHPIAKFLRNTSPGSSPSVPRNVSQGSSGGRQILLTTEGTYPFTRGGVSTWTDALIRGLPQYNFHILAIIPNPHATREYTPPANATIQPLPLWGTELLGEYLPGTHPLRKQIRTTGRSVRYHLLPVMEELIASLLVSRGNPQKIGHLLTQIADFSVRYDLRSGLSHPSVWQAVVSQLAEHPAFRDTQLSNVTSITRSFYRLFTPLTIPTDQYDIVHASASAPSAFPCITAKIRKNTPFILTEHGIYLRERVLALIRDQVPILDKILLSNFYRGVAAAAYTFADIVAPVCKYNTLWEKELGALSNKMRVIYNGVPEKHYTAPPITRLPASHPPTIVFVGRVDPLKDVLSMIEAVRQIRVTHPDVVLEIVGPVSDPAYGEKCALAVKKHRLEQTVIFKGPTTNVTSAFERADLVMMASISEGFPFSVIEAMMCARPLVSTDVGGIPEALQDPRLLVPPQNPNALAASALLLLSMSRAERDILGRQLREHAMQLFTERKFVLEYANLYEEVHAFAF